jgi:hypothetical protein
MGNHGGEKQLTAEISEKNSDDEEITGNGAMLNLAVNLDDQNH